MKLKTLIFMFLLLYSLPALAHTENRVFQNPSSLVIGKMLEKKIIDIKQLKRIDSFGAHNLYISSYFNLDFHTRQKSGSVDYIELLNQKIAIENIVMIYSKEADGQNKNIELSDDGFFAGPPMVYMFYYKGDTFFAASLSVSSHYELILIFDITNTKNINVFGYFSWYHFDHPLVSTLPNGDLGITRIYDSGESSDWRKKVDLVGEVYDYKNGSFEKITSFKITN